MANKIDCGLLLQNMMTLSAEDQPPISENLHYLMEAIITPLLNDQEVPLSDLDFDRFEEDDLDILAQHIEDIEEKDTRLRKLNSEIGRLSPLCVHQPVFC